MELGFILVFSNAEALWESGLWTAPVYFVLALQMLLLSTYFKRERVVWLWFFFFSWRLCFIPALCTKDCHATPLLV